MAISRDWMDDTRDQTDDTRDWADDSRREVVARESSVGDHHERVMRRPDGREYVIHPMCPATPE
ncbi:hypothetical protein DMH03_24460 [Amycolatopsis sp. WAC 01376]|nr:hypothetical protein DMH03_24460 [Amycolatopsis sp. WAC 01376]